MKFNNIINSIIKRFKNFYNYEIKKFFYMHHFTRKKLNFEWEKTNDLRIKVINNILKTNGFYFTKISSSKKINEELNTVDLNIDIELGEKAKIKKIIFLGEKIFKDKRLKEVIASDEHKFWKFISGKKFLNESYFIKCYSKR